MTTDEATAPVVKKRPLPRKRTASSSKAGKVVEGPRTFLTKASLVVKNLVLEEEEKAAAREKKMEASGRTLKVSCVLLIASFRFVEMCRLAECGPRPLFERLQGRLRPFCGGEMLSLRGEGQALHRESCRTLSIKLEY
jgi:hypothetical protein